MYWTLEGTTEAVAVRYDVGLDEFTLPSTENGLRAAYFAHTLARAAQVAKSLLQLYGPRYAATVLMEDFSHRAATVYAIPEWGTFDALVYIDKPPAQGFYIVKSS